MVKLKDLLDEKCWKGYEKKGMKTMFGKRYPNCVKKESSVEEGPQRDRNNMALYIIDLNKELSNAKVLAKKHPKYKKYIKFIQQDIKDAEKKLAKLKKVKPIKLKSKSGMGKISHLGMESVNEYTYGKGDIVKDINPTCPHYGAVGKVKSVNPKSVVFVVMNKGKKYKPGDVLDKTHDQMIQMIPKND